MLNLYSIFLPIDFVGTQQIAEVNLHNCYCWGWKGSLEILSPTLWSLRLHYSLDVSGPVDLQEWRLPSLSGPSVPVVAHRGKKRKKRKKKKNKCFLLFSYNILYFSLCPLPVRSGSLFLPSCQIFIHTDKCLNLVYPEHFQLSHPCTMLQALKSHIDVFH